MLPSTELWLTFMFYLLPHKAPCSFSVRFELYFWLLPFLPASSFVLWVNGFHKAKFLVVLLNYMCLLINRLLGGYWHYSCLGIFHHIHLSSRYCMISWLNCLMKPHYKDIIKCLNTSSIVFYPVNCGPLYYFSAFTIVVRTIYGLFCHILYFFVYKLTMIRGVIELSWVRMLPSSSSTRNSELNTRIELSQTSIFSSSSAQDIIELLELKFDSIIKLWVNNIH